MQIADQTLVEVSHRDGTVRNANVHINSGEIVGLKYEDGDYREKSDFTTRYSDSIKVMLNPKANDVITIYTHDNIPMWLGT